MIDPAALFAVVQAARTAPFFRTHLADVGSGPFLSIDDFARRVPLTDKTLLYGAGGPPVPHLLRGGRSRSIGSILPSSGTSGGAISFGFASRAEQRAGRRAIDEALTALFAVEQRRTLLLCGLPDGVTIHSERAVVLPVGTRHDLFAGFVDRLRGEFDQILFLAEPWFARRAIEEAHRRGVPLRERPVSLVLGGDHVPESLRDHLGKLLGHDPSGDPEAGVILSSFGMGEVGLNLLIETPATVRLRRAFRADPELRRLALGRDTATSPVLAMWDPGRLLVEEVGEELVFTMLDGRRLHPVVRYRSGDRGGHVDGKRLHGALLSRGLSSLMPTTPAPLVWIEGRCRFVAPKVPHAVLAEELHLCVEHLATHTSAVASTVEDGRVVVHVQRAPEVSEAAAAALEQEFAGRLGALGLPCSVRLWPTFEYPWASFTPYEWKFRAGP